MIRILDRSPVGLMRLLNKKHLNCSPCRLGRGNGEKIVFKHPLQTIYGSLNINFRLPFFIPLLRINYFLIKQHFCSLCCLQIDATMIYNTMFTIDPAKIKTAFDGRFGNNGIRQRYYATGAQFTTFYGIKEFFPITILHNHSF